jgi:hypothetical protein
MIATRGETVRASGGGSKVAALDAAGWLLLAAAPTFAIMALLTGVLGSGRADMLCSAAHDASPLNGMVWMYVLMSAFHSAPWLKLISSRRNGAARRDPAHSQHKAAVRCDASIRSVLD